MTIFSYAVLIVGLALLLAVVWQAVMQEARQRHKPTHRAERAWKIKRRSGDALTDVSSDDDLAGWPPKGPSWDLEVPASPAERDDANRFLAAMREYDNGSVLEPGLTVVVNDTDEDEEIEETNR